MALALGWAPVPSRPPKTTQTTLSKLRRCSCSAISEAEPSSSTTTTSFSPRPAVILPGLGNNTADYQKLALSLQGYGVPSVVAKVSRIDWLRNAAGLVDPNYWRGTLRPRPVLDWY
ncbi:hypothetical protein RJ639_013582 [Escallonia herrerae]|uniref:Uncharacterized protein n=1 Tax=Escallonia herrerae TaxID=1293975 RepID=A0AA89AMM8_9ASTE|nr:hypothetical protein RJ639_013582 [Escallonia herrerae]